MLLLQLSTERLLLGGFQLGKTDLKEPAVTFCHGELLLGCAKLE